MQIRVLKIINFILTISFLVFINLDCMEVSLGANLVSSDPSILPSYSPLKLGAKKTHSDLSLVAPLTVQEEQEIIEERFVEPLTNEEIPERPLSCQAEVQELGQSFEALANFCFANLPEYKICSTPNLYEHKRDHNEFFFGPDFSLFKDLMRKNAQTYENRPINYIEKTIIAPNSKIIVMGDIHANVHSLLRNLYRLYKKSFLKNNFRLAQNTYMVFTGDYADRGWYGLETYLILMRLRIANPRNVFLIKGNHEVLEIAKRYGLLDECKAKNSESLLDEINCNIFAKLPSSIFLGVSKTDGTKNWIQFVHGGIVLQDEASRGVIQEGYCELIEPSISSFLLSAVPFIQISPAEVNQYRWGSIGDFGDNISPTGRGSGYNISINKMNDYCRSLNIGKICRGHDHLYGGILVFSKKYGFKPVTRPLDTNLKVFTFMNCPGVLTRAGYINDEAFGIWAFEQDKWILHPYIFNRDSYQGLDQDISELDERACWYVAPDRENSFRLSNTQTTGDHFQIGGFSVFSLPASEEESGCLAVPADLKEISSRPKPLESIEEAEDVEI